MLTAELARLAAERTDASKQLATAQAAADAVAALAGQLKQAQQVATAADAVRTTSAAAVNDRRKLADGIDERAAAIVELEASAVEAAEALTTAAEVQLGGRRRGRTGADDDGDRPGARRGGPPKC